MQIDGESLFTAVLSLIDHPSSYSFSEMRRHLTYQMTKLPLLYTDLLPIDEGLFGSYLDHVCSGSAPLDVEMIHAISSIFGVTLSLMIPGFGRVKCFHQETEEDLLLVYNGEIGGLAHFTPTGNF